MARELSHIPGMIQSSNAMDRPLDENIILRRRRKLLLQIGSGIGIVVVAYLLLRSLISPSVQRSEIRTALVDSGLVEAAIAATGTVVPKFEEVISTPADTRVLQVVRKPGEQLRKGDQFLVLDVSETKLALERMKDQITLEANKSAQLKIDQERTLADLRNQLHIKELNVTYLKSKVSQQERLHDLGASSKDQLDQAKLEEDIAQSEYDALRQSITATEQSLRNQLDGLSTELETLKKEKADTDRQLDILSCRASRDGVLTMVNQDIGATVHKGDVVAKIADLHAYRVDAEASDIHSATFSVGMPAHIMTSVDTIEGIVSNINPTIENGIMKFSIALSDGPHPTLRSNLRVDVAVVTAEKGMALRLASGPFINGNGEQDVFVVHGDHADRVNARIGVAGFNYIEILSGLKRGDEVIISDMHDYLHLKEVTLK
ncbi:MAG TPA: HlyD family efflux transporter periplasmic adaptor subunit [Bacteroidota bacterium]|nr:HlyD family efflux transporter periplasmic adaptor subunit [Bacteroidota bacterium]